MTPRKEDYLQDNDKLYSEEEIAIIKKAFRAMHPDDEDHYIPRKAIYQGKEMLGPFSVTRIEGQYYAIFLGKKYDAHLGAGAFGKIKLAQNLDTGEWVALKIMREAASHEAEITKKAGLGRSSQYTRTSRKDKSIQKHEFVMSLAPGQEMINFLVDDTIPFSERMRAAKGVINEYAKIHQNGILHLDIKLENTFYDAKTGKVTPLDFGLSEFMDANRQVITRYRGTPTYLPAEIQYGKMNTYSEKTEAFSLGVMMAETLGFKLEFANNTKDKKWSEYHPVNPPNASDQQQHELAKLINLMINTNPLMRPSLQTVANELDRIDARPLPKYMTALLQAIESNNAEKISLALISARTHREFNINNPVDIRGNLIHIAAMNGKDKALEALLDNGADVNATGLNGHTALHLAVATVKDNHRQAAEVLLANPDIEVDVQNNDGDTALHIAARNGNIMAAKTILEDIPELSIKNNLQQTAHDLALKGRSSAHKDMQELLKPVGFFEQLANTLGFGKHKTTSDAPPSDTPPLNPAKLSSTEIMQQKLSQKGDLTEALHAAIRAGDLDKTKELCRQGADVNLLINGDAALHVAGRCTDNYNREILDFLIPRADINLPDQFGSTLLHIAAEFFKDVKLIETLVADDRIQVNCQDINGDTPLHIALMCGNKAAGLALTEHPDTVTDIKNNAGLDAEKICLGMNAIEGETLTRREVIKPHSIEDDDAISDDAEITLENTKQASIKVGGK